MDSLVFLLHISWSHHHLGTYLFFFLLHFIEADALVLLEIEAFEEFRFVNIFILEHRVDWDIKGDISEVNLGRLRVIVAGVLHPVVIPWRDWSESAAS